MFMMQRTTRTHLTISEGNKIMIIMGYNEEVKGTKRKVKDFSHTASRLLPRSDVMS